MRWAAEVPTVGAVPRRPPIDPQGTYHIGSRGTYGQPLFRTHDEHELFLSLFTRSANKYGWVILEWVLMVNHHHFVIRLTDGGLSGGMRDVHGGFSRRIHAIYGFTGQGHLFRHGFFSRQLMTEAAIVAACRYVARNPTEALGVRPAEAAWSSYPATAGVAHPRPFHSPSRLLELISENPAAARNAYRALVENDRGPTSHVQSPNDSDPGAA
jgi:REP element-mobilizing transposase RayT